MQKYKNEQPVIYTGNDILIKLGLEARIDFTQEFKLVIKKNALGYIKNLINAFDPSYQWYVVEFPIVNCFSLYCDISEKYLIDC